jgi:phage terminase large subunit-like protein
VTVIRKLKKYTPTRFMAKGSRYDKAAADYAVAFIEALSHTKGTWAGKRFELIDWQEQVIRDVFGTLKPNGYRQFNTAYIEIPKKMGKSELAAAVALLLCCGDGEERAEVYGCASDRQQASIVFEVAADMVRMCPALSKRVKILSATKRIIYTPTNSFYQVLSAEAYSKHGFNISGVVFDELHTQPNRKLFDVMTKGSGDARTQPLYFLITTAGTDTHSICYETHQKAKDILEGRKIDPTFYPVIYGADESDDWTDPKVWKKANPSLGITVDIEKVRAACESAKQNPAEENSFRQLRLNQWVKQAVRWMPMDKWDKCAFAVNEEDLEGRVCYGGLDLSSTSDITAFVLVFPPRTEDERYVVLPYFWMPEENVELRVRRDHVPYDIWERQDKLLTTEGNVVHYAYIEKFIERLGERFNIREIAFDRWGAVQMVQNLEELGFTVVPFGQGFKDMSPPTKELMKLVLEERIAHGGHPVLRWMMDNIFVRTDPAGNIKPDKERSTEKIDGAVAAIMALDRAIRCGNDTSASVYDTRGLLFL